MRRSSRQGAKFILELIKQSHYEGDGYVIQWWRGWIPSNSPFSAPRARPREAPSQVLGEETDIEIHPFDETISLVPLKRIRQPPATLRDRCAPLRDPAQGSINACPATARLPCLSTVIVNSTPGCPASLP